MSRPPHGYVENETNGNLSTRIDQSSRATVRWVDYPGSRPALGRNKKHRGTAGLYRDWILVFGYRRGRKFRKNQATRFSFTCWTIRKVSRLLIMGKLISLWPIQIPRFGSRAINSRTHRSLFRLVPLTRLAGLSARKIKTCRRWPSSSSMNNEKMNRPHSIKAG